MLCCVVLCGVQVEKQKVGHTQLVNQFMFVKCTRGKASSLHSFTEVHSADKVC